jgi:hypothetical protein
MNFDLVWDKVKCRVVADFGRSAQHSIMLRWKTNRVS